MSAEEMMKGRTVVSVDEKLNTKGEIDELQINFDDDSCVVIRGRGEPLPMQ